MFKKILLILPVSVLFGNIDSFAAAGDNKIPTSKDYVDAAVDLKQGKIPAAGAGNGGIGESVVTYTPGGNGVIGERGIYTGSSAYTSDDADKLITAAALNTAFTTLPTTPTTTLACANQGEGCTLWTIVDQTAYGASASGGGNSAETLAMLTALVNTNGAGYCYMPLSSNQAVNAWDCITAPSGYGDWGTKFTYNGESVQISGTSACSSLNGGNVGQVASIQSQVENDYESNMSVAPTTEPAGLFCYCKLTAPAVSSWVFAVSRSSKADCANKCAAVCGSNLQTSTNLRRPLFESVQ